MPTAETSTFRRARLFLLLEKWSECCSARARWVAPSFFHAQRTVVFVRVAWKLVIGFARARTQKSRPGHSGLLHNWFDRPLHVRPMHMSSFAHACAVDGHVFVGAQCVVVAFSPCLGPCQFRWAMADLRRAPRQRKRNVSGRCWIYRYASVFVWWQLSVFGELSSAVPIRYRNSILADSRRC